MVLIVAFTLPCLLQTCAIADIVYLLPVFWDSPRTGWAYHLTWAPLSLYVFDDQLLWITGVFSAILLARSLFAENQAGWALLLAVVSAAALGLLESALFAAEIVTAFCRTPPPPFAVWFITLLLLACVVTAMITVLLLRRFGAVQTLRALIFGVAVALVVALGRTVVLESTGWFNGVKLSQPLYMGSTAVVRIASIAGVICLWRLCAHLRACEHAPPVQ